MKSGKKAADARPDSVGGSHIVASYGNQQLQDMKMNKKTKRKESKKMHASKTIREQNDHLQNSQFEYRMPHSTGSQSPEKYTDALRSEK